MNKEVQKVINELEVEIKKAVEERQALRAENAKLIAERDQSRLKAQSVIEDLTYHNFERDDLSLDECLKYLSSEWKEVHGRTTRQLILQLTSLLAEREAMMKQEPDKNTCALNTITDLQVSQVARAFWRRIYVYRNDYGIELPKPLPVEFMAHMATALTWVDKPAQQIPEGYALADKTELKKIHRDLDSCQKVIWLAGGFDPSYCKDAQESLKLIDAMLSASQPKGDM